MSSYVSHADLGGQRGHGRVVPEPEGELFHAPWEPRALALTLAMGATGSWNIDMSRAARESLPGYARLTYYEIWFEALVKLLAERELALPDELRSARALHPVRPVTRTLRAADVSTVLAQGSPTLRESGPPPRFAPGQAVRMYSGEVPHHTRLPRYVRGKLGTVERVLGTHVFADAHALGRGEDSRWLYTVAFRGTELWPRRADAGEATLLEVSVDAWEPYLEAA